MPGVSIHDAILGHFNSYSPTVECLDSFQTGVTDEIYFGGIRRPRINLEQSGRA